MGPGKKKGVKHANPEERKAGIPIKTDGGGL